MKPRTAGALALGAFAALLAIGLSGSAPAQLPTEPVVTLGHSVQGRAIEALRIGDTTSPVKALVVGNIHGDEPSGLQITAALRSIPDLQGADIWVIDHLNPDGLAKGRRTNAHGVDLNRNFPGPGRGGPKPGSRYNPGPRALSEPESRAVSDLIEKLRPRISLWYHQPWGAVLRPCPGPAPVQREYARMVGMRTSCRGSDLKGTAIGWQNRSFPGSTAIVVELGRKPISAGAAQRHASAAARLATAADPGIPSTP